MKGEGTMSGGSLSRKKAAENQLATKGLFECESREPRKKEIESSRGGPYFSKNDTKRE